MLLLISIFIKAPASFAADSLAGQTNSDWIYWRHYELYVDLLRLDKIPNEERSILQHRSYEFFFRYWVLHRSQYAQLHAINEFEQRFAILMRNFVLKYVDESDPLEIKQYYKDGQFVLPPLPKLDGVTPVVREGDRLPQVEGLPPNRVRSWELYQKDVADFRTFVNTVAKMPNSNEQRRPRGEVDSLTPGHGGTQ